MKYAKFKSLFSVVLTVLAFFFAGYYLGIRGLKFTILHQLPYVKVENTIPSDKRVDFNAFWKVWDETTKDKDPETVKGYYYNAIYEMVSSLGDPYTSFLKPDTNKVFTEVMHGSFQGIGAELGVRDNQLIVVTPLDGSPAIKAGLKAGDKILKIDGQEAASLTINEAVSKIRGSAGTDVVLYTQTGNNPPKDVKITRGVITVPSVTWEDKGDGTAYIRISQFGSETNKEWDKAVSDISIKMTQLDSVIIDVRGNPGGYMLSAIHIAEEFFTNKPVMFQEDSYGNRKAFNAERVGAFTTVPSVIVLIDGGSASASEILAAALRDQANAKLIGVKSFGKGIIEDAKDLSDNSGIHVTVAKWLPPKSDWVGNGKDDDRKRLTPDIVVERTDADINAGKDLQLEKAIEVSKKF